MGESALFVGWGGIYPGRERFARETFGKWTEVLEELKAAGEIERFETVLLGPHGGELVGFTLVFGLPEKLATLPMREDLHRLQVRATLDHAKFSVIWATTGDAVEREFQLFDETVLEYDREPALV
jgi:hypothetical protein